MYKRQEETYATLSAWLVRERADLEDDVVVQDILEQVFYGLAYEKEKGQWAYLVNAHRDVLYKQQFAFCQQGKAVTPLWTEACGYRCV